MSRRTLRIGLACTVAITGGALVLAGCGTSSKSGSTDKWRIGVEAPLSGDLATLGKGMLDGAQLAAKQLNEGGGVLGKQIEIVPIDDGGNADTGVTAANNAIKSGLNGVVGPYNSSVGIKTLPLYIQAGVVPIRLTSDTATNGEGFTLQPMSDQIAPVESKALKSFYKAKSVAIIYDASQNYTVTVSDAVKSQLGKSGVKVTNYIPIQPGQSSYSDVVKQAQASKPSAIFAAVYAPEGAKFAQEIGTSSKCLLDYASYDTTYIQNAGAAASNCQVGGVPAPDNFKDSGDYVNAYQTEFGTPPGTWSPYTYDSLNFLTDGATKVGNFDSGPLTDYLKTVKGWTGWTGSVNIDPPTGNRTPATVVVTQVANNAFTVDQAWAKAVGAPY